MMRRFVFGLLVSVSLLSSAPATAAKPKNATPALELSRSRVLLSDLVAAAPEELAELDLGAAPAPGSSRLITRDDVLAALPEGTDPKSLKIPASTRVVRKTKKLAPTALEQMTRDAVSATGLPRNGALTAVRPRATVSVPDGWDAVRVEVPKPPRKSGKHLTTATLVFTEGEGVLHKVPVPIEMMLPKSAAIPDVKKGSKLTLLIERGAIQIKASVTAAADADVGEEVGVVLENKKVLRARVESSDPPTAVEAQ